MTSDGPSEGRGGGWFPWFRDNVGDYQNVLDSALALGADIVLVDVKDVPRGVIPGLTGYLETALEMHSRHDDKLLYFFPFNVRMEGELGWYIVWRESDE